MDPPWNPAGSKIAPKIRLVAPKAGKNKFLALTFARLFRDPVFHETTVILVPLEPSVFKNITFSMMIGYFSVFSAFRCAMFYMSFLSHLLKKTQ